MRTEANRKIESQQDEIERLTAEVSKYKPFYDAVDDEAVSTWTLDSKLSPKEQLAAIIGWHVQVATDPSVNGGYELAPVSGIQEPKDTRPYKERFPEQYCLNCGQWLGGGTDCCANPKSPTAVDGRE